MENLQTLPSGGPGSQGGLLVEIPPKNRDIHASAEIWKFFRQQSLLTGHEKAIEKAALQVYPNPFTNCIQLSPSYTHAMVTLSNIFGQVQWQGRNIGAQDFAYLQTGMYVLQIQQGREMFTLKVCKE